VQRRDPTIARLATPEHQIRGTAGMTASGHEHEWRWVHGTAASPSTAEGPFDGSQRDLVPSSVRASNSVVREPTGAGPEHDWSSRGRWGMRFLTIYRGEITVVSSQAGPGK
jgi:hypothetical protein